MKTLPPVLTPFVRSNVVGAILAEVFVHLGSEFTLAELGRLTGAAPAVVHKEVSRLVKSGVLADRRQGHNRLVRVNQEHPLFEPMAQIVAATYGPVPVLRDLFSEASGVDEAFIYGSWAARRSGVTGGFPGDVDVMVIGQLPVDDLVAIQSQAREQLSLVVNIHRTTASDWRNRSDNPFLAEVASRPTIALTAKGGYE